MNHRFILALITVYLLFINPIMAQNIYYIDSQNGNDNNDGLTENTAWKSHTMVSTINFQPGDIIAFKKGSQFSGPIQFTESGTEENPIKITSYGEGELPHFTNPDDNNLNGNCIRISGSWVILENLYFHDTPPTENVNRLSSIFKMGAVFNMPGADHNIIRNNVFINCTKGIQSTGEYTLITDNYLDGPNHALWIEPGATGAWGPMGMQLGIGNQEVSYNTIKNYLTTDSPYGSDGGAIELDDGRFHKDNYYIHHNYTEGNAGFIESSWGADYNPYVQEVHNLKVAFNVNFDGQDWLYMWAPCHDCFFDNNTVIRTNDFTSPLDDGAYLDYGGINFRNNLFVYTSDAFQGPGANKNITENNWYLNINNWSQIHWDDNQAGSGDPGLINLSDGDYHLAYDSPLRGNGINLNEYYSCDFDGNILPQNGAWDVGAFQYQGYININSPGVGEIFNTPAEILIESDILETNNTISKVEFFCNSKKIGEDDSSPFSYTWSTDYVGTAQITAIGTTVNGSTISSNSFWILITNSDSTDEIIWNSYDVITKKDFQPAIVYSNQGKNPTVVELYMSINEDSLDKGNLFSTFSGQHIDMFNHVENLWSYAKGYDAYPYAGKSTVDRGSDNGESNAPEPLGVRDLQLHPPDSDYLTVAVFVAPFNGQYNVSNPAVRRVYNQGNIVTYKVFDSSMKLITSLTASNNRTWIIDSTKYDLGFLSAGDRIYFAVDRGENDEFYWDASEIAWTVTKLSGTSEVLPDENSRPSKFGLEQNYPNPFNTATKIKYTIANKGSSLMKPIQLKVYDILGKEITTLVNEEKTAGIYETTWEALNFPSGVYFYQLSSANFVETKKMLLLK